MGTRSAHIFEQHERWRAIEPWIVYPDGGEQRGLHEQLYLLKKDALGEDTVTWLEGLACRHEVDGIIFGCTELHLLHGASRPAPRKSPVQADHQPAADCRPGPGSLLES